VNPFEGYDATNEQDPYCYDGTTILRNKLDIQDHETLEAFELEMSTLRASEPLPDGSFDPAHYCAVHHHLFQDVYDWAGVPRTIQTAKGGNLFCLPAYIERELAKLFATLSPESPFWNDHARTFVASATDFLAELNAIHPFREGNGRAQLAFVHLLGQAAGHPFDLTRVRRDTFLPAMIASFSGQLTPLQTELAALLAIEN
jgi:cell filamentation protein